MVSRDVFAIYSQKHAHTHSVSHQRREEKKNISQRRRLMATTKWIPGIFNVRAASTERFRIIIIIFVFIRKKWKCLRGEDMNFWCTEYRDELSVVTKITKDDGDEWARRRENRKRMDWCGTIQTLVLRSCMFTFTHLFFSRLSSLHSSLLPPSSSSPQLLLLLRLLPFFSSFHFIWVTKLINTLKY